MNTMRSHDRLGNLLPHSHRGEIEESIDSLSAVTSATLGQNLLSLHVCGSIATGDFDVDSSDIDFVTVTRECLSPTEVRKLKVGYAALRESGKWWDSRTEGIYLPEGFCRRPNSDAMRHFVLRTTGELTMSQSRSDWVIQLKQARDYGIQLAGKQNLIEMVPAISPQLLREAVLNKAAPFIEKPENNVQAKRVTSLHVLSACRLGFTFITGGVVSKPVAAEWAKSYFPSYSTVIEEALLSRGLYEEGSVGNAYGFIDAVNTMMAGPIKSDQERVE